VAGGVIPSHLEELKTRVLVDLVLRPLSPLHIGAGEAIGMLRSLLRARVPGRDGAREFPTIPSSTLKGAMRSLCEKLAKKMEIRDELTAMALRLHHEDRRVGIEHAPEERSVIDELFKRLLNDMSVEEKREFFLDLGIKPDDINRQKGEPVHLRSRRRAFSSLLAFYCPICRLFGSPGVSGLLRISDAVLVQEPERTLYKYGVGIDRRSLTAKRHLLYAHEILEPTVLFKATLVVDNIRSGSPEALLLASLLDVMCKLGLQVGARKSAGYGLLIVDDELTNTWFLDFTCMKGEEAVKLLTSPRKHERMSVQELISLLRRGPIDER